MIKNPMKSKISREIEATEMKKREIDRNLEMKEERDIEN